jgi:hypothetical protein
LKQNQYSVGEEIKVGKNEKEEMSIEEGSEV